MKNKEEELLNRIIDTFNDDDDVESILRVLMALSVGSMKIMEISKYEIETNYNSKITLEVEEKEDNIIWQ